MTYIAPNPRPTPRAARWTSGSMLRLEAIQRGASSWPMSADERAARLAALGISRSHGKGTAPARPLRATARSSHVHYDSTSGVRRQVPCPGRSCPSRA